MSEAIDDDLYQRTKALLEPGEIRLNGVVVNTDMSGDEEPTLHQATLDIGHDRFGVNQHQGLTLDGDAFVWEGQQLMRDGTYDVVFYYEADADQTAIVDGVEELGFDATGVRGDSR